MEKHFYTADLCSWHGRVEFRTKVEVLSNTSEALGRDGEGTFAS